MLVGHSIAGLTTRLHVGEHPADFAGVVPFDPTVASFARMFDDKEFRPGWDGTASASQVEQVTTWPDIPFWIVRHDPAVYATRNVWSDTVQAQWGADEVAFATLAPKAPPGSCRALVTTSTKMPKLSRSLRSGGCWAQWSRSSDQPPHESVTRR